jgi:hypothetical protein
LQINGSLTQPVQALPKAGKEQKCRKDFYGSQTMKTVHIWRSDETSSIRVDKARLKMAHIH